MSGNKVITSAELQQHTKKDDLYILIHGKVYAVSKFVDEHPGGDEVIAAEAGKDATEAFEDVGHSDEARELLKDMFVGDFEGSSSLPAKSAPSPSAPAPVAQTASNISYFVPLAALAGYFAWRFYSA
ncbi:hypothetical protein M0805_007305 [Coniferiporia weirii]|nr:hypothetical protein M0805_007305 [Coniferiporia weirii]